MLTKEGQCVLNISTVLNHYGLHQLVLVKPEEDRCWFRDPEIIFWMRMTRLVKEGRFKPWNFVKGHGATARYGWREFVPRYSVQVVFHVDRRIEADIDLYNPDFGALYASLHAGEVLCNKLRGRKTSPYKVAEGLHGRGLI